MTTHTTIAVTHREPGRRIHRISLGPGNGRTGQAGPRADHGMIVIVPR